jgi:hypothetical protein
VLEMQAETEAVREHATAFAQRGQIIDKYRERSMYIYIHIYIYIYVYRYRNPQKARKVKSY